MINQRLEMEMDKEIKNRVASLPKLIRDIILNEEWKQWVGHISKKNTLNLDQAATLEHLVLLFMIGMLSKADLRSFIEEEVKPGVAVTNNLIVDINDYIIEPLKKKLIDETVFGVTPTEKHAEDKVPIFNSYKNTLEHRDEILAEIERPSTHPVGVYTPKKPEATPASPVVDKILTNNIEKAAEKPVEKLPGNLPSLAPEQEPAKLSESPQVSIIEKKLGIVPPVTKPAPGVQKTDTTTAHSTPKTYTVDPYREMPGKN